MKLRGIARGSTRHEGTGANMKKATLVVPIPTTDDRMSYDPDNYEPKLISGYVETFDRIPLFISKDDKGHWWITDCSTGFRCHSYPYRYKKSALEACPDIAKRLQVFWNDRTSAQTYDSLVEVRQEMKKRWETAFPNDKESW